MPKGTLLVITGPSAGAGKDTLRAMFLEKHPDWQQPLSTTTRDPRPGEEAAKTMNFVSHETFTQWQAEGKFLESDFHAGQWYGTLREPVEQLLNQGRNVLLRIDVNGALKLKEKLPEAVVVFVKAENLDVLKQRMQARGDDPAEIEERLALAEKELTLESSFENVVVNGTGGQAVALAAIEKTAGLA